MSEFNELVKAFLLGNNIYFEESEKEPNTFILSAMGKKQGFFPKLFERLKTQKESLKIFILDGIEQKNKPLEINDEADIIIWNDSFSGKGLENKIEDHLQEKTKKQFDGRFGGIDPRYMGMGRDILYAKYFGENRVEKLLDMSKETLDKSNEEKVFFTNEMLGEKRFAFILEETGEKQYLKREFNRFMDFFCKQKGPSSQSLPIYFESIDFWFGGFLHAQLTNRLNQDLGLFLTEDTIFYMTRLGYIIPFINEMDLFCREGYLNPQTSHISHLFHLCGGRGMFVASCSWDSILYEDIRDVVNLKNLNIREDKWIKTIARPMGSRILDDEVNSKLFGVNDGNKARSEGDFLIRENEVKIKNWIEERDFPILKPIDKTVLLYHVARQWMERGSYFLALEDFNNILFEADILPEGKRTLAHIHEIVRASMNSNILNISDFNQVIPISRSMGDAIILRMLEDEFYNKKSLKDWMDRPGFTSRFFRILLKRFSQDENNSVVSTLSKEALDILNKEYEIVSNSDRKILENAMDLHIVINNSALRKMTHPVCGKKLFDLALSHKIIYGLKFREADMHNTLFQQSVFIECNFEKCNLISSYFAGSTFINCRIEQTILRNADFSGSYFQGCILERNVCDDLILIGCSFRNCKMDIDISSKKKNTGSRIWSDGSSGICGQNQKQDFDLPVLIYLMQKKHRLYSQYGFKIDTDIRFNLFQDELGTLKNEKLREQYNYCDVFDEINRKPELLFAKPGSIYYIQEGVKKEYKFFEGKNVTIDHVIKYKTISESGQEIMGTKILFHTDTDTFVEENPIPDNWFENPVCISNKFVGRGVSGIFLNQDKMILATDNGGMFLFLKKNNDWINTVSKFQSEPVNRIFPDSFENMVFIKRGSSVIEIWDTLNDLSMGGRLVTSFSEIVGIRLIENLNHAIIYGEWADESLGALAYNIINKHLITYWDVLSSKKLASVMKKDHEYLEIKYFKEAGKLLESLKEKSLRQVSLENGFIKKGCKELRQIMDTLEIIPPGTLAYMEGEPLELEWRIESSNPGRSPVSKAYLDVNTGEKVDFECEIKIGNILDVQSGKLKIERMERYISVLWKENRLELKESPYGDHKIFFCISLLGETREREGVFKFRAENPFKGGESLSKTRGSDYLFVGRETELKTALELISKGSSFSIKGARRIGKTSFMNRLRETLPGNVLSVYISFEEFETNSSQSSLLSKIQTGLHNLMEAYPGVYNEFREDLDVLTDMRSSLDFEWLMSMGLNRLKEEYPDLVMPWWLELEKERVPGKSLASLFDKLSEYLKKMDKTVKIVFIIDEIGIVEKKGIKLNEIFTPFRPIIDRGNITIILAGIPFNFHELTQGADLVRESGFMSFLYKHIILGPLTDVECRGLIRNNLSNRIKIEDNVLNYALQLSAMRPEDLQIIMHQALENCISSAGGWNNSTLSIDSCHIDTGFGKLLEERGYTCAQIWEKISDKGKSYLKNKLNANGKSLRELLDVAFDETDLKNIRREDIDVFKGYGFTNPDEKMLIIPVYFQEWVRQEFYLRQFKKED